MTRWIKILATSILASALLFGCANNEEDPAPPADNNVDENQDLNDTNVDDGLMEDDNVNDNDRGTNDDDGLLEDNQDGGVLDNDGRNDDDILDENNRGNEEDIIEDPKDVRDKDLKDE